MKIKLNIIRKFVPISFYRKLLNQTINRYIGLMDGKILDIGGEKENQVDSWNKNKLLNSVITYVNINKRYSPDILASAYDIPVKDKSYDVVFCFELLEHLEEPSLALKEISRILKINGRAFISMPFMYRHHPNPNDFQRWTQEKIQIELNKNLFEVEFFESRGGWLIVLMDILINGLTGFRKRTLISFIIWLMIQVFVKSILFISPIIIWFDKMILKSDLHSNYYRYSTGFFAVVKKVKNKRKLIIKDYMRYPKKI